MEDGIERRALLLHLGNIIESIACVSKLSSGYSTMGEAVAKDESLADFSFLTLLNPEKTLQEYVKNVASAFFLWPRLLLDEELDRALIANLVQANLFAGNQAGWDAYVSAMRQDVPWFGEGLAEVSVPHSTQGVQMAPWPPEPV